MGTMLKSELIALRTALIQLKLNAMVHSWRGIISENEFYIIQDQCRKCIDLCDSIMNINDEGLKQQMEKSLKARANMLEGYYDCALKEGEENVDKRPKE